MTQKQPTTKTDTPDFIYVPSLDLYVGKNRICYNRDWNDQQQRLHSNNQRMPTLHEGAEFLLHLYSHLDNPEYIKIFDDMTGKRDPIRGENFDAHFEKKENNWYITYHEFNSSGKIKEVTEELDDLSLMSHRTPGIYLGHYIKNHTHQGLPKRYAKIGSLYYWSPADGAVARFRASSVWAGLGCGRDPDGSSAWLGVRAVVREIMPGQSDAKILRPTLEQVLNVLEGECIPKSALKTARSKLRPLYKE